MSDVMNEMASIVLVGTPHGIPVQVADSVAFGSRDNRGQIVVCGSHGGHSAGEYAATFGFGALISNDAGRGLNDAGVAGLRDLDAFGIPAAGVSHVSARIGDGWDVWQNGVVSYANDTALRAGVQVGSTTMAAVAAIATWLAQEVGK